MPHRRRHLLLKLCGAILGLIVLLIATWIWLTGSESGARFGLFALGKATGIQFQGITGNLNHQLHIQHIEMQNGKVDFSADGVELQWHGQALFKHQILLDYLRINNLEVAIAAGNDQPISLPATLRIPEIIKLIKADQLEIIQFQLSDLEANHVRTHPQQFSAMHATMEINSSSYSIQFSSVTPWGSADLKGNLASTAPFNIDAQISWLGLAVKQNDVSLPKTSISGKVSGNLSRMQIQAQVGAAAPELVTDVNVLKPGVSAGGRIDAIVTPFSALPVDTMHLDFVAINPASFYKDAPKAELQLSGDFKVTGSAKTPVLSGHVFARNASPATWNSGGIPVVQVSSDLMLSEHSVVWKNSKIDLEQNGLVLGGGELILANLTTSSAEKNSVLLPNLTTHFDIKNVNLIRLDSRLKKTQLSGNVQAENKNGELNFGLHLQESNPNLNVRLAAEIGLDKQLKLNLRRLELIAKDATLSASGSFALREKQEFLLGGEAHNFNPARWIDVPDGHIATRFHLAGQVQKGWQIDGQLSELSGQFAGLDLHGEAEFHAMQGQLLAIKKFDVAWGKNHLSASGTWQLGTHPDVSQHQQIQFAAAIPDLAALSQPFEKILAVSLQGSLAVDGVLSGNAAQPSGHVTLNADKVAIPNLIYLDNLHADVALDDGAQGKINGNVTISGIAGSALTSTEDDRFKVLQLQAKLTGVRHAHTLSVLASLPQKQQITLHAEGDLPEANSASLNEVRWAGKVQALNLTGPVDFQLVAPFNLLLSGTTAQMGEANWQGQLGHLHVQQVDWQQGQLKTSGEYQDMPVVKILKLWRNDVPLSGQLMLASSWHLEIGQQVAGFIQIQRASGDLSVQDTSAGHTRQIALGLKKLVLKASSENNESQKSLVSSSRQQIKTTVTAQGDQLGLINIDVTSYMNKTEQGWVLPHDAALLGQASLQIGDIRWMSQLLGSGISLGGELDVQATLNGTLVSPDYQAKIHGGALQVSFTELGVLLPNGTLLASIEGSRFKLTSLKFSQSIKKPPRHDRLNDLSWLSETGYVESTGEIDLRTLRGSIATTWEKFPFLQNPESWMVASGQAQLAESEHSWNVTGKLITDAAYFSVPKQAAPKLSGDVVVLKKNAKRSNEKSAGLQTSLDFSVSTGKNFIFVGRGIDTRLDGDIRIRSKNGGTLLATGSIQTMGGTYEGYGQQLAIDRGILNFQGPIDNPGLNVRAIRRGLPVEAGVEVVGTVAKPEVHLISEPNVPDPDKLSWMVLGRPSDQMAGSEATLLMSAAGAIFGGDNGSNIPSSIAHSLGLEDLTFGTTSTSPESQLPTQTVAGTITSTAPVDQAFSIGKRIAPDIVFSIERSLTDASNGLKLTWQLTRRFSIIGRAGSDTAIDGQYTFTFE
jgi:translocation and assembly module TamB